VGGVIARTDQGPKEVGEGDESCQKAATDQMIKELQKSLKGDEVKLAALLGK